MFKTIAAALAAVSFLAIWGDAKAAVSYATAGSTYSQDFNGLPIDTRTSANIETGATGTRIDYVDGWRDDTTTESGVHVSIPGWYLYHPLEPTATPPDLPENGVNGHQRIRFTTGNTATGAFYGFAATSATNPEKALGAIASGTLAPVDGKMFFGLKLTNDTGATLNQFTLSFTGEQWREGGSATLGVPSVAQSIEFEYKVTSVPAAVLQDGGFTGVNALKFTSQKFGVETGAGLDGNDPANRIVFAPVVVNGVNWTAGSDLWLRWADTNDANNDHGLGIDDLSFSAEAGSVPTFLPTDFNQSTVVDNADLAVWAGAFGTGTAGDADDDDDSDGVDFLAWQRDYGKSSGGGVSSIPEPGTLTLAALCVVAPALLCRRGVRLRRTCVVQSLAV